MYWRLKEQPHLLAPVSAASRCDSCISHRWRDIGDTTRVAASRFISADFASVLAIHCSCSYRPHRQLPLPLYRQLRARRGWSGGVGWCI